MSQLSTESSEERASLVTESSSESSSWVPIAVVGGLFLVALLVVVPFRTDLKRYMRMRRM